MEGIELEMTKEELRKWIREKVTNNALVVDMMETSRLLQSLLERRENEAVHLLQLCRSVVACEAAVRKHYVLLGWEYKETDSDDDNNLTGCAKTPPSAHEFAHSESEEPNYPSTKSPSPVVSNVEDNANLCGRKAVINLTRQPVVVLNRLPPCKIKSLCRPTPQSFDSEDDVSKNSDSESLWEPHEDSSDSYFGVSSFKSKRRKLDQENENANKISQPADSKSKAGNAPQANTATKGQRNPVKVPKLPASAREKRNAAESSTLPAKSNNQGVAVSTLRSSGKFTKTQNACNTQEGQICVDMNVLARSRSTGWQMGTIVEIVTKEDGRVKYKISFADNRRSLVSGHHMAFGSAPKLDQLDIGTRVVVRREGTTPLYSPATVAEVPSTKNQMRFLVFFDDHTPCYVSLPSLHLVCKPLDEPLDDIANEHHRNFMKDYRRDWPYPPWIHYKVGQIINAERNGVLQRCVVEVVDCSLIQVLFQKDQHKDWIYRGSTRLEYIIIMRKKSLLKK